MPGAELDITTGAAGRPALPEDDAMSGVIAAMDAAADRHLDNIRPDKTKSSYARDWALWTQYMGQLAEHTGQPLPLTAVTKGTLVGFVVWLDTVQLAAPSSIDRRITGVTVTARGLGYEVPKDATKAARKALKPLALDEERRARGRGKAPAATPEQMRRMSTAEPRPRTGRKKRGPHPLALLRDRALVLLAFGIAGRAAEVSKLDTTGIVLAAKGLEVHVPSVKGRPARDVVVTYGQHEETCAVRAWLAWKNVAGLEDGPAFRAVSESGRVAERRLTPDSCRIAFTRAAERAALDVRLTGHSARSGLITSGRAAGKPVEVLREQSGHAPTSAAFWGYIRNAEKWDNPATEGIGL